jgi:hypothetical protein
MQNQKTTIEKLFPNHSTDEQKEIEAAFDRYLDLVGLVYEDIKAAPELYDQLRTLTAQYGASSMDPGRTFTSKYHDTDV